MKTIITGGAGFIGCNAASRYLRRGDEVVVIDNLSRPGCERNVEWLKTQIQNPESKVQSPKSKAQTSKSKVQSPESKVQSSESEVQSPKSNVQSPEPLAQLTFFQADIRNGEEIARIFRTHRDTDVVLHLAGQVAVTTSVSDPRLDFEANALGTFNVLEAARLASIQAPIIFSSTNKVYGGMEGTGIVERNDRYAYENLDTGVNEQQSLDFHSPYGCSKGAADQYVRDYARIYGLETVVFRQSCIYGYRQFGVEDQGWVAWFIIAALLGRPITVYGDGKQVRDVLFIDDLLDAFDAAAANIQACKGQVFNIGGGPANVMSLRELLDYLGERQQRPVPYNRADWRPGDQRVFVSDISKAREQLAWAPGICVKQGLDRLYDWVSSNKELFQ